MYQDWQQTMCSRHGAFRRGALWQKGGHCLGANAPGFENSAPATKHHVYRVTCGAQLSPCHFAGIDDLVANVSYANFAQRASFKT